VCADPPPILAQHARSVNVCRGAAPASPVGAIFELYKKATEKKRNSPQQRRMFENEVLPAWRYRRVQDITRRDIACSSTGSRRSSRGRLLNGNPPGDFMKAQGCGSRTRRGTACQCPAIRGRRRCRLHGGRSTGPRTPEGRKRVLAAVLKRWELVKRSSRSRSQLRRAAGDRDANDDRDGPSDGATPDES
jgi:hypothetical protein